MSLSLWTRLFNWKQIRRSPSPSTITVTTSESSSTVDKGTTRVVRVTVLRTGARYTGTLTPSTNSLPSGVTSSFSPSTLSPSDGFTDMTLTADAGAGSITDDAYTVTISGTGINAKTVNQTITVPDPLPPQSISIAPDDDTVSIQQGQSADITYTLTRAGAYTADVPLAVTGLPSGVTASYPDGQTYQGSEQTKRVRLTVDIAASTVTNDAFTTTAAGDGGSVTDATDSGTVTVTAAPSAGGTPDIFEDWSDYANEAALDADKSTSSGAGKKYVTVTGVGNGSLSFDASVTFNGHKTLRGRIWPSSTTKPLVEAWHSSAASCWVRRVVRWSPGFSNVINNGYTGGKSHKQTNYALAGVQGRVLGTIANATNNVPGGQTNSGDLAYEVHHKTGSPSAVYLYAKLRDVYLSASDAMYTTGDWYEEIVHTLRVDAQTTKVRVWFNKVGATRTLLCTLVSADGDYPAGSGVGSLKFFDTFNALDGGAPATGVDQSFYLGEWEVYDDSGADDPYGLGYTAGDDVSLSAVADNATVAITAGGASVARTITVTRGADLSTRRVFLEKSPVNWPSGLSVSFSAATIANGSTSSTLTFTATGATVAGVYACNVRAVTEARGGYGAASDYVTFNVTVS